MRLLGFELDGIATASSRVRSGGAAYVPDKSDNRWRFAARDSVCWPYDVAACGSLLVVADASSNRVLLWEAAS